MTNKVLKSELIYVLLFILLAVLSSLIFNLWAVSFLIWSLLYIIWKWIEFYFFYQWYIQGTNVAELPSVSGIWEDLSTQVIQKNNQFNETDKKNKKLISQFNLTTQALPYATLLLDENMCIQWVNEAAHQILGVMKNSDEGNRIDNIIRDPKFVSLLKSVNKTAEIRIQHPLDITKKIHAKLIKLSNEIHLLVARDISEQESLRKSRKAFIDNASHELRTPLTVIVGYLEMLHRSKEISGQWHVAIDQALNQSQRMESIINDMLKLSSIEHQRYLEDNDDVIDMPVILNGVLQDIKSGSQAKGHEFVANIDSDLNLKGNIKEITSIVLNLMNNAVIHTAKNTEVSLKWFKHDNKAHLWICDNGDGIEQKHLLHLTERFYRVDNSRDKDTQSTGLGLAIVKQICDNHNATLSIESELQKGTCFKVEFPSMRIIN